MDKNYSSDQEQQISIRRSILCPRSVRLHASSKITTQVVSYGGENGLAIIVDKVWVATIVGEQRRMLNAIVARSENREEALRLVVFGLLVSAKSVNCELGTPPY